MTDLQIFKNAPPDASVEELKSYPDGACGSDATLRSRVEALFQAGAKAGGFMKRPAIEGLLPVLGSSLALEGPGTQIGRYKLLQEMGAAEAIGPVLLGMKKPVHILQLGSSVREIVNMVTIAVVDAQSRKPSLSK
jgi:hypothetical protein